MTIIDRALELVDGANVVGLGSGRAAQRFVRALGEQVRTKSLDIGGVPTSEETATLAREVGIPLLSLADAGIIDVTVDGADEVDPDMNLIKGYGRAMVREKVVAHSSRRLVILVGTEKVVPRLGSRGRLPVEVVPFALPLCERMFRDRGWTPVLDVRDGQPFRTDNGNYIVDCAIPPIDNPAQLDAWLHGIPGVVGTGLFVGFADHVLVGHPESFELVEDRTR